MEKYQILVINPGSTSDEVAYFEGDSQIFHKIVRYDAKLLEPYEGKKITEQFQFRRDFVLNELNIQGVDIKKITAVIGRGGLLKPLVSGVYEVNEDLKDDLKNEKYGSHASNLGALLADSIAQELGIKSYIANPVTVDEMLDFTRYSGMPENPRISIFHCLNQKRVGHLIEQHLNKEYKDLRLIIAHMGGGISIGAHLLGKVVDVNNALDGEGPFSPQRAGSVPSGGLVKLCFSDKYSLSDIKLMLKGKGGMVAYTGTSDMKLLEKFAYLDTISEEERKSIKPDVTPDKVKSLIEGMAYQISKDICSLTAIFNGRLDAIVLTGGLAYSDVIVGKIKQRVSWIAPVFVFPGGDEMQALRSALERALNGQEEVKIYKSDFS
ncbi:MAG TPA: butyrate kinase [Candidatus Eremiobacteraeota bacterium]|nr:MAG: Butyrate kinase 2 [bacterium ADurb.Bin363]HPZ10398.1 butyrate kinase [Candidatus Eremiobacteraeota bacterium]